MSRVATWLYGLGLGAGLMYLLDPNRGRRRRALIRDQMVQTWRSSGEFVDKATRDLQNRATGLVSEASTRLSGEEVSDAVLAERVRSALGRVVSHPRAILVSVDNGRVILTGPVLAREVEGLLERVGSVRGVTGVENQLEVHQRPGNVPGLQGNPSRWEPEFELFQENWAPSTRLMAAAGGGVLTISSLLRGGWLGLMGSLLGLSLVARGIANAPVRSLTGRGFLF